MSDAATRNDLRGLVTVTVEDERDLPPSGADVRAPVTGASMVSGGAALKSAREIAGLVHALAAGGVASEDVHVEGVSAQVQGGLLTKSSSATYDLRVRVPDPSKLSAVLGVLASTPSTSLHGVEWRYPAQPPFADAWTSELAGKARARAAKIAETLGERVTRLRGLEESFDPSRAPTLPIGGGGYIPQQSAPRGASFQAIETGAELTHVRRVRLRVTATFEVEPIPAA